MKDKYTQIGIKAEVGRCRSEIVRLRGEIDKIQKECTHPNYTASQHLAYVDWGPPGSYTKYTCNDCGLVFTKKELIK